MTGELSSSISEFRQFYNYFFGHLSPFEIIVAIVSFSTAIYTVYKNFLEQARLSIHLTDHVGIVIDPISSYLKIHIKGIVVNKSVKVGVLNYLEAELKLPTGRCLKYVWNVFFYYREGNLETVRTGYAAPVPVNGKDSRAIYIELVAKESVAPIDKIGEQDVREKILSSPWVTTSLQKYQDNVDKTSESGVYYIPGPYQMTLNGWVNKPKTGKPNMKSYFVFRLSESDIHVLRSSNKPAYLNIQLNF